MPIIRVKGWQHGTAPSQLPDLVPRLFGSDAGLDGPEVANAVKRLRRGKVVDVQFDPGDEAAASALIRDLESLGLSSTVQQDRGGLFKKVDPVRWYLIAVIMAAIVSSAISRPWLGLVLLTLGVGGIGCAATIRVINQRSQYRLEALRKLGRDRDAG